MPFFVNDVATEIDEYTTTRLARAAAQRGHQVWYVGLGDVELGRRNGQLMARAHAAELDKDDTLETFMARIQGREAERLVLDGLDVLFLRNDSIEDLQQRPWASPLGAVFGQMLKARGVTVVNDPVSLMRATSKLYLEEFPEKIRPRSLVTRDPDAIGRFVGEVGRCVVKPLRPPARCCGPSGRCGSGCSARRLTRVGSARGDRRSRRTRLVELSLRSVEPGWPAQHERGDPIRIADGQVQRGPSAERDAADDEPSKLKLVGEGDHVVGEGVECGRGRVDVTARAHGRARCD